MKYSRMDIIGTAIEDGKTYEQINRQLVSQGMDKLYPRDPEDIVGIYCSVVPFKDISAKEAYDRIKKTCKEIIDGTRYANAQDIFDENNKPTYNSLDREYERMRTDESGHINTQTVNYTIRQAGKLKSLIEETYEYDDEQKIEKLCEFLNDNKEYYANIGIKKRYYMVKHLRKWLKEELQDIAALVIEREKAIYHQEIMDNKDSEYRSESQIYEEKIKESASAIFKNSALKELQEEDKQNMTTVQNKLKDKELELISIFAEIESRQSKVNKFFYRESAVDFNKLLAEKERNHIDDIINVGYGDDDYRDKIFDICIDKKAVETVIKNNVAEIKELFGEPNKRKIKGWYDRAEWDKLKEFIIKEGYKRSSLEAIEIGEFIQVCIGGNTKIREGIWNLGEDNANIIRIIALRDNSRKGVFDRKSQADIEAVEKLTSEFTNIITNSKNMLTGKESRKETNKLFTRGGRELGNADICRLVDALPDIQDWEKQKILQEFDFSWKYDEFVNINQRLLEKRIWR